LDTRYGPFRAHVFQDLIDRHYVLALAHGDIATARTLYTRLHSSCVSSETLRGCDCDCVEQLDGAFRVIAEKGHGIIFYLMQEGRGVGYVGKARDRMLVQASLDQISTFAAYTALGLRKDHRNYDNIAQICHLLGIQASWIVLTNNPDKVEALREQGLTVAGTEPLECEPSPYNLAYLTSKAAGGHRLRRPAATQVRRASPPEPVTPFKPHALPEAQRFIATASYFLPVRPVDHEVVVAAGDLEASQRDGSLERAMSGPKPLVLGHRAIRGHRHLMRVDPEALARRSRGVANETLLAALTTPYWFRVHVYYDIVSSQEFVVLTYGQTHAGDHPIVHLHSETLFERFPLRTEDRCDPFSAAVKEIVAYGSGAIHLVHHTGSGGGFGIHASETMLQQSGQATSAAAARESLGVGRGPEETATALRLLRHHIPSGHVQMLVPAGESPERRRTVEAVLAAQGFTVHAWVPLGAAP
jgi:3,4-dihydroxy 2-butanone 4-phosphate synthase/GTP cyclohydrolase II